MSAPQNEKRCNQLIQHGTFNPASTYRCTKKPKVFADGEWWCAIHSPEAQARRDAKIVARIEERFAPKPDSEFSRLTAELSTLKEQLHKADGMANEINILTKENRELHNQIRLTNEMLAAADHIGGYLDIARGATWSIHSDHDSGWHYSIDDKIVASGKSMLEAYAAIKPVQKGD
jgi:hypothetical protein